MKKMFVNSHKWLLRNHSGMLIFAWCLMGSAWFLLSLKIPVYAVAIGAIGLLLGIIALYGAILELRSIK